MSGGAYSWLKGGSSSSSGSGSSSGGSGSSGAYSWLGNSGASKPSGGGSGGGVFGVLGNLGSDIKSTVEGLPTGLETLATHPIRAGENIAKTYEAEYSPLFHGHFGQFAHELYAHPLGPLLDALTLVTLGAGGVARAGSLLSKAGAISDTSRLANLGRAAELTVPSFGDEADIVVKQTSRNPLIRLRQETVNKALNKLPSEAPVIGSTARGVRALLRQPERAAASLQGAAQKSSTDFGRLTKVERAAWHLKARGITPAQYIDYLAKTGEKADPPVLRLLKSPEVSRLVAAPSRNLRLALDSGRALSDHLTALRVAGGHIDPLTAEMAPYRHLRLINGATYVADEAGHTLLADQPGREIPALMKEIDAKGGEQPFHVTDSAHTNDLRSRFSSRPSGYAAPLQGVKQSQGILFSKGLINFKDNALARDYRSFASQARAQLIHDELVKHASILPKGEPLPHGYDEIKLNRGQASAPYTLRAQAPLDHELSGTLRDRIASLSRKAIEEGNPEDPHRLIVPTQVRKVVEDNSRSYRSNLRKLAFDQPTSVWKHLILGLRPAFFGNITVGNSLLGMLQMAPGRWGMVGWLNQVLPGAEKLLGRKLSDETMKEIFPEQAYGTFGHSVGFSPNAGLKIAQKAYQGVMPATIAYENVLRRSMAEGWAKATPEVQALMRHNGGDVNAALRQVAKTHPQIINDISKRVDDALGNYRSYSRVERAVKAVVPFYGWNRHITRSVARLALERPQVLDALYQTGEQGKPLADKIMAALPEYLQGSVGVHLPSWLGGQEGSKQLLTMNSLNPFNTLVDEGALAGSVAGKPGSYSGTYPIHPLLQALIEQMTNKNLLTGHDLPKNSQNRFLYEIEHATPQQGLLHDLMHGRHPSPKQTNQNGELAQLLRLLGLPVENVKP